MTLIYWSCDPPQLLIQHALFWTFLCAALWIRDDHIAVTVHKVLLHCHIQLSVSARGVKSELLLLCMSKTHYDPRNYLMLQITLFIVLSARGGPRCRERRHPETHASPLCFKSFNFHNQACISRHLAPYQLWAERDGAKKSNSVINGALLLHIIAVTPPPRVPRFMQACVIGLGVILGSMQIDK